MSFGSYMNEDDFSSINRNKFDVSNVNFSPINIRHLFG